MHESVLSLSVTEMGSQTAFSKTALTPVCVLFPAGAGMELMNIYGSDYLAPGLSAHPPDWY